MIELAIVEWVTWFNNDRLHESLGDLPPAEFETLRGGQALLLIAVADVVTYAPA